MKSQNLHKMYLISINKPISNHILQPEIKDEFKELNSYEIVKKMKAHYPGLKVGRFPRKALNLDFERDILPAEKKLTEEYGF